MFPCYCSHILKSPEKGSIQLRFLSDFQVQIKRIQPLCWTVHEELSLLGGTAGCSPIFSHQSHQQLPVGGLRSSMPSSPPFTSAFTQLTLTFSPEILSISLQTLRYVKGQDVRVLCLMQVAINNLLAVHCGGNYCSRSADTSIRFNAGRLGLVFSALYWKSDFCSAQKCYVFHYFLIFVVCHELQQDRRNTVSQISQLFLGFMFVYF